MEIVWCMNGDIHKVSVMIITIQQDESSCVSLSVLPLVWSLYRIICELTVHAMIGSVPISTAIYLTLSYTIASNTNVTAREDFFARVEVSR